MEIETEARFLLTNRAQGLVSVPEASAALKRNHGGDVGVSLDHLVERLLQDNHQAEIGPMALQQCERRRGEYGVAERAQPDEGDCSCLWDVR